MIKEPSSVKETKAYWISPCGEILAVPSSHIDFVIEFYEKFLFNDKEYVEQMFKREGENEVLRNAVRKNWIRIRLEGGIFFIAVQEKNSETSQRLSKWAYDHLKIHPDRNLFPVLLEEESKMDISVNTVNGISKMEEQPFQDFSNAIMNIRSDYELWSLLLKETLKLKLDELIGMVE
jgi:hypothetical protein